ncbi:36364_t:CDS:2, partial [Racocetra persica]
MTRWDEVTANTIRNCWYHTKILPTDTNAVLQNLLDDIPLTVNAELDDLDNELEALHNYLTYPMKAKELLSIPEEDVVYEIPDNDQVIVDIVNTFRTPDQTTNDPEEENDDNDDSTAIPVISTE